ncbi:MAG TPA: flagellar biosynthesis protein FlgL [Xanthobacteraceae bacterium]|jgi:flagellin-like hook-associated protein FlgL|nr:flagellar biosynthesis protein FlgL [Xanthobacteraceae bacterium]
MSITGPGSITAANIASQTSMMNQLNTLAQELGSGQAAQTYSDLQDQAGVALSLNGQLAAINGYSATAQTVGTTLTVAQSVLSQLDSARSSVQQDVGEQSGFTLNANGQTTTQAEAANQLGNILSLLNTQVGDNYIFSGSASNQPSVASESDILNGNGAQAGLTQVISERQQADLGITGLGHLSAATSGSTVTLSQDGTPFGFQLSGVDSSLTGATATGPSGSPPAIAINLPSDPNNGDTIQFQLTLPDGSTQTISLQATTNSPAGANQFTVDPSSSVTAGNLQTALTSAIGGLAQTALPAASAMAAANNFFSDPPQRVNGSPPDTSTALVNGTPANTVFWYTGENGSTPALQTATAQVGPSTTIDYGMRANEQALSTLVANVAVLAATTYSSSDSNAQANYEALSQDVAANLNGQSGTQSIDDIAADLANAQTTVNNATTLNTQTQTTLQDMMQNIDGVNQNQIGEDILTLQNNLSASMSVSARLAQLSLVNYLGPVSG